MAQVLSIRSLPRPRRRAARTRRAARVHVNRLVFPTANGEDQVFVLPSSCGEARVWLSVRSVYDESMQSADLLLNRSQLRSVIRLLARSEQQLDRASLAPIGAVRVEPDDEARWRPDEEWYDVERGGFELPEDY